jgi:tetratricopeptide (TPR) repeat protein
LDIHEQLSKNSNEDVKDTNYSQLLVEDYINVGLSLDYLDKYSQAIDYYDKALDIDKYNVTALDSKGYALYNLKEYDKAIDIASQAISIDRNYTNAWYNRAVYYANTNKIDNAISDLKKAISLDEKYGYDALEDNDFDNIKNDSKFVDLLEKFKDKN